MVSIEDFANGCLVYARDYLIGRIPKDNYKYVLGNVAIEAMGYKLNKNPQEMTKRIMDFMGDSPWANLFDIIISDGMVDLDMLKKIIPKYVQPEGFKVPIPVIGMFTILPSDVDTVYNCIIDISTQPRLDGGVINNER